MKVKPDWDSGSVCEDLPGFSVEFYQKTRVIRAVFESGSLTVLAAGCHLEETTGYEVL